MVMIDDRQMLAGQALDAAFEAADGAAAGLDHPLVGIFGHGAPETLISASGAVPVHVNFGRLDGSGVRAIDQLIEPFVDHEVRIFLNRFAAGAFTGFAGIVFVRDDAAAPINMPPNGCGRDGRRAEPRRCSCSTSCTRPVIRFAPSMTFRSKSW